MKKLQLLFGVMAGYCLVSALCYSKLYAATNVSGIQTGTWTVTGSPYVLTGNVTVPIGQMLTIDPGVVVQFTNGNNTVSQLIVSGTLKAQGTASSYINFTGGTISYTAQRGPITFEAASINSILQYVNISQLGYDNNNDGTPSIIVKSSSCTISNCTIQSIKGTAISIANSITPAISNNIFTANENLDVTLGLDNVRLLRGNNPLKIGLVTSSMGSNDTLVSGNTFYRLLNNQTVELSRTLVINPGVEVQFTNGNSTVSQLMVEGTLKAVGTASNYIKFTGGSISYTAQRGPITFANTSSNSAMQYVNISQLGYDNNNDGTAAIIVKSSSCTISNCNIQGIQSTAMSIANSVTPVISNNIFAGNENLDVILGLDNVRLLKGNNPLKIGLVTSSMGSSDTLVSGNTFYRLLNNQTVDSSRTLVISPGVEVQFTNGDNTTSQLIVKGTLKAVGTASGYIKFTGGSISYTAQRGPITFESTSTKSVLQYVNISELGYYYNSGTTPIIIIKSSSCQILNTIFQKNNGVAVQVTNAASPVFLQSCFYSNTSGAVLSTSGKPKFRNCNFLSNVSGIVNSSATDTVDARSCWWGSASGPRQRTTNPTGVGDSLSARVTYINYSTQQFDCAEDASPLLVPLTLLNFQASLNNNHVNCTWQTASESNTSHFIIQHSAGGIDFSDIGKVGAAGNSGGVVKSYQFTDNAPFNSINYYRLKMIDKDGQYTYSKVLLINITSSMSFVIFPNPVRENLSTQILRDRSEKATFLITDIQGKVLYEDNRQLQPGITSFSFNTSALAKGTYFLILKGDKMEAKTFVKE